MGYDEPRFAWTSLTTDLGVRILLFLGCEHKQLPR